MISKLKKTGFSIFFLCLFLALITIGTAGCKKEEEKPSEGLEAFKENWQKQDFKAMYSLLSTESRKAIDEGKFIERYSKLYKDVEVKNLTITLKGTEALKDIKKNETAKVTAAMAMDTLAGKVEVPSFEINLVRENVDKKDKWFVNWSEKLIFPMLEPGDVVQVARIPTQRGKIIDRNGFVLAVDGELISVGIDPKKFAPKKDANIAEMSRILEISPSSIQKKLSASANPDWFVPIVNLNPADTEKISKLMKIDGVLQDSNKPRGRIYPGGEYLGCLIGHTSLILGDDLEKLKGEGYTAQDYLGKAGLEEVYEKRLRGEVGWEIYTASEKDNKKIKKQTIARKDPKPGEDIKLTIDAAIQELVYKEMKKEPGAAVVLHPKTGEILAMVSSPSYDSNVFSTYKTDAQEAMFNSMTASPKVNNRFKKAYAPGSTFKLVTAAIGLKTGKIKPEEAVGISGKQWQNSSSWGSYKVTRVSDIGKPVNLTDAFIYSDNIYFAMASLKIDKGDFIKEAKNFGIGEEIPIAYPLSKSQLVNGDTFKNEITQADTGYGQAEVQTTPLNIALIYSALVNNGDIVKPVLELGKEEGNRIWHEKAMRPEDASLLLNNLKQVIDSPNGTAHDVKINGLPMAGKTGTAEVNKTTQGGSGEENGWFVALNTDNPRILTVMVIENVKNKKPAGSHFVTPIVKRIMEQAIKFVK